MDRIITYHLEQDQTSIRGFLKEKRYPAAALSQLKRCPDQVSIERNGEALESMEGHKLHELLRAGDTLKITIREEKEASAQIVPVKPERPLRILFEDEDLLVVDKEAGMAVHPSLHHREDSLANAVAWYLEQKGERIVFRCIHRLDKETSGVIVIAKNMLSGGILAEDMQERRIGKTYVAVCDGVFDDDLQGRGGEDGSSSNAGIHKKEGVIGVPIGRQEGSVILRRADPEKGQPAETAYRVLKEGAGCSLVEFRPKTGRCHQIRIHAGVIGHPLLGDYLYYPHYEKIGRVALHAWKLELTHPLTGEKMVFESPIPEEFERCLSDR